MIPLPFEPARVGKNQWIINTIGIAVEVLAKVRTLDVRVGGEEAPYGGVVEAGVHVD
jgi:hypothetical protein